jgi:hypothetical protein
VPLNLSVGGVAVAWPYRASTGQVLQVRLWRAQPDFSRTILFRVVHVSPLPDGDFRIGGEFLGELSEPELSMLLS